MRSAFIVHDRVQKTFEGPSMTKQSFKDEVDINNILAKYQKTGLLDHVATYGGSYGDMPTHDDFHEAMNIVTNANSMFADLPATVRERFDNDPAKFLDFVSDPENREALVEDGLIPEPEGPVEVTLAGSSELEPPEPDAAGAAANDA